MKIVVTGGAGFIGLHLVNHLLKKENQITILDNFSNSDKNLTKILQHKNLKIIEGDIRKINDVNNCLKEQDMVIHLAAKISVSQSILNPSETFEVNVDGTKNVLEACKKNNIKKPILLLSLWALHINNIRAYENVNLQNLEEENDKVLTLIKKPQL